MKWHGPACCLPGGGGLLARVWKRFGGRRAQSSPHSSLCSATHQPYDLPLPLASPAFPQSPPGRRWRRWWLWSVFVEADSVLSGTEFGALGRCEPSPGGQVPFGKKRTASCNLFQREDSSGHPGQQAQPDQSARGGGPPVQGLAGVGLRPQAHLAAAGRQGGGQVRTHCTFLTRWPLTNDSLLSVTSAGVPRDIMASFVQMGDIQSPESLSQNPHRLPLLPAFLSRPCSAVFCPRCGGAAPRTLSHLLEPRAFGAPGPGASPAHLQLFLPPSRRCLPKP